VKLDKGGELWRNRRLLYKTPEVESIHVEKDEIENSVIVRKGSINSKRKTKIYKEFKDFKMY